MTLFISLFAFSLSQAPLQSREDIKGKYYAKPSKFTDKKPFIHPPQIKKETK